MVSFKGDDNDIKITALVPHLPSQEPYDNVYSDPENIEVRFVKSQSSTSEIASSVQFNDDPGRMKWEITITLPTDSNGNVTVTAEELCAYINSERSPSPTSGVDQLPPRTTSAWKAGDFIHAEGAANQGDEGKAAFDGNSIPSEAGTFLALDRSLKNVLAQGEHLSYGLERAELKTNFKHTDNDVLFTAVESGEAGERISVEYYADEAEPTLRVDVETSPDGAQSIRVRLALDANGKVVSTAGDVAAAVNGHYLARTLVTAQTPEGESGLGLVDLMDKTYLDRSGYFTLVTYPEGEEPSFHRITVNPDDTLEDVLSQIGRTYDSGVPGLRVETLTDIHGKDTIRIFADDGVQFGYAGDNSGALAALGLNTIFTGSSGSDIGVNQLLIDNRGYLSAGHINSNGAVFEGDNANALAMSDLKDKRFDYYGQPSATLSSQFNAIYADIGTDAQAATRSYDFTQGVYTQLQDRLDSIAGVNLDEELADILRFQYMYQAAAKMISTIDTMMETLLAMR